MSKKTSKLVIRNGAQVATVWRLQHGDVRYLTNGDVVKGSYSLDTLDRLLEIGTIDARQHDNARRWYKDYFLTQAQMRAISYEAEYGNLLADPEYLAEAEMRYKRALRMLPFNSPTLPVTVCICLDGMSLRQAAKAVRKDRTAVKEALLCGLEILEEVYG